MCELNITNKLSCICDKLAPSRRRGHLRSDEKKGSVCFSWVKIIFHFCRHFVFFLSFFLCGLIRKGNYPATTARKQKRNLTGQECVSMESAVTKEERAPMKLLRHFLFNYATSKLFVPHRAFFLLHTSLVLGSVWRQQLDLVLFAFFPLFFHTSP